MSATAGRRSPATQVEPLLPIRVYRTEEYLPLIDRVDHDREAAAIGKWQIGRMLSAERQAHGGKQLPNGRLAEIARAADKPKSYARELEKMMVVAERLQTVDQVRTRYALCGGWRALCQWVAAEERAALPRQKRRLDLVDDDAQLTLPGDWTAYQVNEADRPRSDTVEHFTLTPEDGARWKRLVWQVIDRERLALSLDETVADTQLFRAVMDVVERTYGTGE
jgi:hypothetical protein